MPIIDNIDGPNRDIYLHSDTVGVDVHPIDIYKEMRTLRANNEELRKYDVFLSAFGRIPKGGGTFTERYVVENAGTRIIPFDANQLLRVTGTIITDDGQQGRDCFDRSSLVSLVDIDYQPPQVEVIEVITGSAVTEQDKLDIADRVWDEQAAQHVQVGSAGEILSTPATATLSEQDKLDISNNVWEELELDHVTIGTVGAKLRNIENITEQDMVDIMNKVWNKVLP